MDFVRQHNIFNPDEQKLKITIIGAGSSGSFMAMALSKFGYKNVKVIDFDIVEEHNIPVQIYKPRDKGKLKVEALSQDVFEHTGEMLRTEERKIDESYQFLVDSYSVIVVCVDNMEARKIIYQQLKTSGFPLKLIDTRMGGEGFSIHTCDMGNQEDRERYEKSLEGTFKELPCGEKAVIYCIMSLVAEGVNIIKKIEKSESYPKILRREMKTYRFIHDN
jgi:molybdopterin/thiamine biosynthesis adenylyltransferase